MPKKLLCLGALLVSSCTYGPEQERSSIEQVIRLGDSYRALMVVQSQRFRDPTGLNTFPNGGRRRVLEQRATLYLLDASQRSARALTGQAAPDDLWESFAAWIGGVVDDSVAYLRLTGCPRGGECHPSVQSTHYLRVTLDGGAERVPVMPSAAKLPGEALARRQGEQRYVRFSTTADAVTARFEEGAAFTPVFQLRDDGSVVPAGGSK